MLNYERKFVDMHILDYVSNSQGYMRLQKLSQAIFRAIGPKVEEL